jgi:transcriptional regulator with XRE-family HTH domain
VTEDQAKQREMHLLGRAIRDIRTERHVSIDALAQAAGVEPRCVRSLEAGRLDPRYDLLLALSKGLGVQPSTFVLHAEALAACEEGQEGHNP